MIENLLARLPFAAHVSHAYTLRETATYGGADHIVVEEAVTVGRLRREPSDALCKPRRKFRYLVHVEESRRATCKRCIEIAERLTRPASTTTKGSNDSAC